MPVASTTADTATFVVRGFSSRSMASGRAGVRALPAALAPRSLLDRVRVGHAPVRGPVGGAAPGEAGFERDRPSRGGRPSRRGRRRCSARDRRTAARGGRRPAALPAPPRPRRAGCGSRGRGRRAGRRSSRSAEMVGRVQPGPCSASPRQSRQLCSGNIVPSCATVPPRESPRFDQEHGEAPRARGPAPPAGPRARRPRRGPARAPSRPAPAVVAASTSCTRSITRMRSCRAFTAFASVRTHCGQADTRWSAPAATAWSTRRARHRGHERGLEGLEVAAAAAAQGVLAVVLHLDEPGSPGSAREHLARLVVVAALAAEVAGVVEGDHPGPLRLAEGRGARRRGSRAAPRRR